MGIRWKLRPHRAAALLLALLAFAALISAWPAGGQSPTAQSQSISLTATPGWTVTLTLNGHTSNNWWFKINWWGSCTAVTNSTTVSNIGGYTGGPHSVWAYSDGNCGTQIASTTFIVPAPSLAATVNPDRSVDLTLSNGPSHWSFRIGGGICTPASGSTVSGIRGYQAGTYYVDAGSGSGCGSYLTSADFTIPSATLRTTVNDDRSVDLSLSGGPGSWWFRINWWGTCTAATGTSFDDIRGYAAGSYSVAAYSDSGCNYHIASSSFTIPTTTLAAAVDPNDWSVDLTLTGGPSNWWFKINWWGACTAASGTSFNDIRGYHAGEHIVAFYAHGGCDSGSHFGATSFTIPSATLTATPKDALAFDLTLTNGPNNWWFKINSWGTCTPASGTTVGNIQGYAAGAYDVRAYSDSGCNYGVASLTFSLTDKPAQPAAPALTSGNAQLTAAWTAPGSGSSAITDYDLRYRATGTSTWNNLPANHGSYTDGPGGRNGRQSNAGTGAAIDLGNVSLSGLTVTKESGNVYKIAESVDTLRVRLRASNAQNGTTRTYVARYASTSPTIGSGSNMGTHGTELWKQENVAYLVTVTGDGTAIGLSGPIYFWITTTELGLSDGVTPTIEVDAATVPATLAVTITGLTNGTEYEVQVRAENSVGESAWSPSGTLKTGLPAAPTAPTLVVGNAQLDVSWTAPSGNGSAITDYDLRYSSDSGATWTEFDASDMSTETTDTITGLTNDTSYIVQVRAGNSVGDGAWSPSSATLAPRSAPDAPNAPTLTAGARQLTATWTAPDAHTLTITDYDVQYRKSGETDWTDWAHTGTHLTATTASLTGLDGAATYEVRVRAESSVGEGAWSPAASLATNAGTPDAPEPTLTAGATQITVNWTAPHNGGAALTGFKVQYKASSDSTWLTHTFTSTGSTTSTTIGSLTSGTSYDVQVRATNTHGDSPWSVTATAAAGAPGQATVTVTRGDGELVVAWTAPADNGSAIDDYDVRYREAGTTSWTRVSDGGTSSGSASGQDTSTDTDPFDFGNLSPSSLFTREALGSHHGLYKVSGNIDEMRVNFRLSAGTKNFQMRTASSKPTNLDTGTILATSSNNVLNALVGPFSANDYFWFVRQGSGTGHSGNVRSHSISLIDLATTDTSYTITGVTNSTVYEVSVRAGNARGDGAWSAPLRAPAATAPATTAAPTLTPGNAQLTAAWTAPANNNSLIADYDARYRATGTTDWKSALVNVVTYNGGNVGDMTGQVIDLGTVALTGLTVNELSNSVYKITEPVDALRVKVYAYNGASAGTGGWRARYDSTPPSDRYNDGTLIWARSVGSQQYFTGDGTAFNLPANTHFWVSANSSALSFTDDVTPTIEADRIAVPATLSVDVTGLTNGTEYEVQVRAQNAIGESAWSSSATLKAGLPAAPAAPTVAAGDTELDVTWTAPSGNGSDITDYDLRYSSDSGATWTEFDASDTSTATTDTITGLTNNTSYIVQVRAGNSVGDGAWSPSSASVTPQPAPAAPSAPTLTAGSRQLTVEWTAPTSVLTITDYDVQYRKSTETDWSDWAHTGTAVTATITGLDGAVTYQVRVRAESAVGEGAWSPAAPLATTVGKPDAPAAPTLVTGNAQLTVNWTAPYNGGSALSGFKVQYKASTDSTWTAHTFTSTGTTTTTDITGLTNGTTYNIQVLASNAQGDGPWSATASTTVGAPGQATATASPGNGQIVISWTAPADNGAAINDYDVRYRQVGGSWLSVSDGGSLGHAPISGSDAATSTGNPINFGALGNGIVSEATSDGHYGLYKVPNAIDRMRIYLQANSGSAFSLRTAASKPTDLSTGTVLASSATSTPTNRFTEWVGPIAANGYFWAVPDSGSTTYTARYRQIHHIDLRTTSTTYTITGLTNGTAYEVSVQAANSVGGGQWSAPVSATPGLPATPSAPTLVAASQKLFVTWTAVSGNGSAVTDYDLRYSSDSGATWTETADTTDSTSTTATITGLTNNTSYVVQVRAGNARGDGPWSPSSASGTPVPIPDPPVAPTLTTGNAQLAVAWTAPANGGSVITDYDMRYRVVGATNWTNAYIRHASYSRTGAGQNNNQSNGSTGQALDLGTVSLTGLTVTKVTTGGIANVYKITEAVGGLRIKLSARNVKRHSTLTYQARYAASAPTTSNMNSHGTLLWEQSVAYSVNLGDFTGDAATGAQPANTHFWITTTGDGTTDIVAPTIQADAAAGVPSTLTSSIGSLTNNTSYEVQLRASNANGAGGWSPSGTIKVGLPAQPSAPALVSSNQQLDVTWTAVSGNGSNVTDYDVRYSSDGGTTWTEMTDTTSTATSATITGLTNGTAYLVQVRAGNTHGDGLWSPSSASVTVGAPAAPAAPTLTPAASQITVAWTAPANSGSTITDYDLRYCSSDCATASNWTFFENGTSTSTTATITNVTASTAYQVQVRAENARDAGGWSPATTLATLTVSNITDTTATLTFARGSHTGDWYVKETSPATNASCSSAISGTTHNLSSRTRNTTYTYQAYSDSGCSTVIAIVTFSTLPSSLTASSVSNETVTLTISSDHTGNWYLKETSPSTTATCSSAITGNSTNLSSLTDGVPYVYYAYSDSECTTAIARGTFTTTLYPPTGLSFTPTYATFLCYVDASWSKNTNTTGSVGYVLNKYAFGSWGHWHTITDGSTSYDGSFGCANASSINVNVRAFRTTGGVTVYSVWVGRD